VNVQQFSFFWEPEIQMAAAVMSDFTNCLLALLFTKVLPISGKLVEII